MLLEKCEEVKTDFTSWECAAGQITAGSCGTGGGSERQPRMETLKSRLEQAKGRKNWPAELVVQFPGKLQQ